MWDKSWNRAVYNPYGFVVTVGNHLPSNSNPRPTIPYTVSSSNGLAGIEVANSATNRKLINYVPTFNPISSPVLVIAYTTGTNIRSNPPPVTDTAFNRVRYEPYGFGTITVLNNNRSSRSSPLAPIQGNFGIASIEVVNSATNRKPVLYTPVFNPISNTISVTSYKAGAGGANNKLLPPTVTESIFNRSTQYLYGFGTVSNNYNLSTTPGLSQKLSPISGYNGFAASISVSTSTRARFNYNLPITAGVLTGQQQMTVTSNYSNTIIYNKTVSIGVTTTTAYTKTIPHVKSFPVISRRLSDFGPKTLNAQLNKPITTVSKPSGQPVNVKLHTTQQRSQLTYVRRQSDLGSKTLNVQLSRPITTIAKPASLLSTLQTNAILHLTQQRSQVMYVRRLSDLGPKTLNTQINGVKTIRATTSTNIQSPAHKFAGFPIYIRRTSDLGAKTLNTQLNGIKIAGTPTPLYTVAVPGSYNVILPVSSTVVGYWS